MYNLDLFASQIIKIRKNLNLSQEEASNLAKINKRTLRRIENGECIPKLETLNALMPVYYVDLINLFNDSISSGKNIYDNLIKEVDLILSKDDYSHLESKISEMDDLLEIIKNEYYKTLIIQLKSFCEGILSSLEGTFKDSLDLYIYSISLTKTNFSLDTYKNYTYNLFELRILSNLAKNLFFLDNADLYVEILEFCKDNCIQVNEDYIRITYTLANAYTRTQRYNDSLNAYNEAITHAKKLMIYTELPVLFYGKGSVEYLLGLEYLDSFKSSLNFIDLVGNEKLKSIIIEKLTSFYDIDLDIILNN